MEQEPVRHLTLAPVAEGDRAEGIQSFTYLVDHCGLNATRALLLLVERYGLADVMRWHRNLSAGMGRDA